MWLSFWPRSTTRLILQGSSYKPPVKQWRISRKTERISVGLVIIVFYQFIQNWTPGVRLIHVAAGTFLCCFNWLLTNTSLAAASKSCSKAGLKLANEKTPSLLRAHLPSPNPPANRVPSCRLPSGTYNCVLSVSLWNPA